MYYDIAETGKRIQKLRKEHGLTQEQLANKINVSDRHIRHIETGEKSASIDLLVAISILFDTSLDYVVLGKESPMQLKEELNNILQNLTSMVEKL